MNRNKGIRFFVDTIRDSTFLFFFFFKERKQIKKEPRNLVYIYIYLSIRSSFLFVRHFDCELSRLRDNGNTMENISEK